MITLPTTAPAISCFNLPAQEYHRRLDAAEERVELLQVRYNRHSGTYGLEIMWHPSFSNEYVAIISKMPLHEISSWQSGMAAWANGEEPLDLLDYCYLADCLREGLASQPTPLAALRLKRALAMVKHAGAALLAAAQVVGPHLTSEPAIPATLATAA